MSTERALDVISSLSNVTTGQIPGLINTTLPEDIDTSTEMAGTVSVSLPTEGGDASWSLISPDFATGFSFITNAYVTPALCIVGLLCNSLGLNVLWKDVKQQKVSVYKYLLALVCFDITFLAISLIRVTPSIVGIFDLHLSKYIDSHMKLGIVYADMSFSYTAKGMILVMSCERLVSLVKPLHVKNMWLSKYPLTVIFVCFIFNAIFLLPVPINAEVVTLQDGNQTDYMFKFKNHEAFMKSYMIVQVVVQDFFPITCLVIINMAIPLQYYRITRKRLSTLNINSESVTDQQGKITITVLIITVLYILLITPTVVVKFLQFFDLNYSIHGKYRLVLWFAIDVNNLLSYINAANDFLVYFLVSNNNRNLLKRKFCGCCAQNRFLQAPAGDISIGQTGSKKALPSSPHGRYFLAKY